MANIADRLKLLSYSFEIYKSNLKMVVFFSIPFIFALLLPLFSPAPTYSALGGYFLRSGSLPDLTVSDVIFVIITSLVSLYLFSLALVAVNLVVKSARTRTRVASEAKRNLGKYTFSVFLLFLVVKVIEFCILTYTSYSGFSELSIFVFSFIASLGLFYSAPAIVLEERKPLTAFFNSFIHIIKKPLHFILWLVVAFLMISIVMQVLYTILEFYEFSRDIMQLIIVLVNSLFILPFLIILQAQIYLAKYTILR